MSTLIKISSHDTDPTLYAALSRTFKENVGESNSEIRWVTIWNEGVELTFFAPKAKAEEQS